MVGFLDYFRAAVKIRNNMKLLFNYESFKNEVKNFEVSKDNSYARTYIEFVNYFNNNDPIDEHHLIIGSHFVYGWMPTIITFNIQEKEKTLKLFNKAKSMELLDSAELDYLKGCINKSLVGLSKLLHFINPEKYAIWDSRIFRYVTGKKSHYGIGEPKNYLEYLSIVREISSHDDYQKLHDRIAKHYNYSLHPYRAIEVVLFEADKKAQNKLKAK